MSTPPLAPSGPVCRLCNSPATVNWARRLTSAEMAALIAREKEQRAAITAAAPPEQPPVLGPMPTPTDSTKIVLACEGHSIGLDLAILVHQSTCTAPNPADLPGCDCTPEESPTTNDPAVART